MRLGEVAKTLNQQVLSEKEIEELHQVLLIILDDLIKICECYDLHFILIGGSAIGALRDKGFIAWDDDIDIAMPRKDFEKLYKIVQTIQLSIQFFILKLRKIMDVYFPKLGLKELYIKQYWNMIWKNLEYLLIYIQ